MSLRMGLFYKRAAAKKAQKEKAETKEEQPPKKNKEIFRDEYWYWELVQ